MKIDLLLNKYKIKCNDLTGGGGEREMFKPLKFLFI